MTSTNMLRRWWSREVSGDIDHDEVVTRVRDDAGWSAHFAFMTILSAGIAILGLLLSSPAVVIGAMLISPLMGPIIGAGFALATFDTAELRRAVQALVVGIAIAIAFCAGLVALSPLQTVTSEIAARTRPNLFDLLVALLSGFAGTYAVIRGRHGAIVGVAIATALMPPIAVMGFGIATGNMAVLEGSGLLFFTNLMTIAAAAAALARLYGFAGDLSPQQTRLQLVLFVGSLALLAVPLAISLNKIAWEAVTSREVTDAITSEFGPTARIDNVAVSYDTNPLQVSATVLTPTYRRDVDRILGKKLESTTGRPVDLTINQVRTSDGTVSATEPAAVAAERGANDVADSLAMVAGVTGDDVLLDAHHHLAQAIVRRLPGANLATYHAIEQRLAGAHEGWNILLIPPAQTLSELRVDDPERQAEALATVVWAAKRLHLPVEVQGRPKDADPVVEQLGRQGIEVVRGRQSGNLSLSWAVASGPPARETGSAS